MSTNIQFGHVDHLLQAFLQGKDYSSVHILFDSNTLEHCLPLLNLDAWALRPQLIEMQAGEEYKTLKTCELVWNGLIQGGADRSSLFVSVGGGVVTDLGGFCAASFMRGIDFVHVPTSVLGMTDAAIGGKQGVDFQHYKNYVGTFEEPQKVIIDTRFLRSLPAREVRSGLAEVIKHGIIGDPGLLMTIGSMSHVGDTDWDAILKRSVAIKQRIVEEDAFEQGIRAALNFGHTIGHAIETFSLGTASPLRHGEAVALGMLVELRLSHQVCGLPEAALEQASAIIGKYFEGVSLPEIPQDELWDLMLKDKKKKGTAVRFSLVSDLGAPVVNAVVDPTEVNKAYLQFV